MLEVKAFMCWQVWGSEELEAAPSSYGNSLAKLGWMGGAAAAAKAGRTTALHSYGTCRSAEPYDVRRARVLGSRRILTSGLLFACALYEPCL